MQIYNNLFVPSTLRENEYNQIAGKQMLLLSKQDHDSKSQNHGPNSGGLYQPGLYNQ